jgi:iron complex outermembrane receptor protein
MWQLGQAWTMSVSAYYASDQYMDNDEPNSGTKIPSYVTADLRVDYRSGPWLLSCAVKNLFDEEYFNYAVRSQFTPTRYNAYPLPGRTWWAGSEYRFR